MDQKLAAYNYLRHVEFVEALLAKTGRLKHSELGGEDVDAHDDA